jgi:hypothetical protein
MYGGYDAYLVYGIRDNNANLILDESILEEYEAYDIGMYASEVVRCYMCMPIYGYSVRIDVTGQPGQVPDSVKEALQNLYNRMTLFHEQNGSETPTLGYFMAVGGDYEKEHSPYFLDAYTACY